MTLRASSVKKTSLNLFLATVKKSFGIIILITIFMLLVCPGYIIVDLDNHFSYLTEPYEFSYIFEGMNYALTFLSCAIAGIGCFINFNFVYSKKSGDLYFALPTTRNGLMLSRFFASIIPAVIPTLLCYGSMGLLLTSKHVIGDIKDVITGALISLILVMMTACITMLFIVCAGSMVDLLISFFTINVGAIAVMAIFMELCATYLRGFDNGSMTLFYSSSPFLYAFEGLQKLYSSQDGFTYDRGFVIYIVRALIISVICLAASIILFKRRKAEKCTSAYAYRGMYYACNFLFSVAAAFIFGYIFSSDIERIFFWVFAIFGAILGAITFGLITDRGFKKIKTSIILGLCSYVILIITTVILSHGGLGYTNYIPKAERIKTVSMEYNYNNSEIEFTDPQYVIALHKKIIESEEVTEVEMMDADDKVILYGEGSQSMAYREEHATTIRISYELKNGSQVNRYFWIKTKDCEKEIMAVLQSKENIAEIKKLGREFIDINIYGDIDETENSYFDTKITREECGRIVDAYAEELLQADEEILYSQDKDIYIEGTVVGQTYKHLEIRLTDDFEKTINLLRGMDLLNRSSDTSVK